MPDVPVSPLWLSVCVVGAVGCGGGALDPIVLDEPFDHVVLHVDGGDVTITGSPDQHAEVYRVVDKGKGKSELGWDIVDGVLYLDAVCHKSNPTKCDVDHDLVLPSGVTVDAWVGGGSVELTATDGLVTIGIGEGEVRGAYLLASEVAVTAGTGDVDLQFAAVPDAVDVGVGIGSVLLMVPQGYYDATFEVGIGAVEVAGIIDDDDATEALAAVVGQGDIGVTGY